MDHPWEQDAHYWEAVRAGRQLRQARAAAGQAAGWEDPETRLFLHALQAYGRSAGLNGSPDITSACLRELLEIDPADHLHVEDLAREVGLISAVDEEAGMSMQM